MSFFNKIFGGGEKKPAPAPVNKKPPVQSQEQKAVKIEATSINLQRKIKTFQDNERKLEHKIDLLKAKAKEYIGQGKKKQAKKYVQEATKIQKQVENYSLRRKVLENKKFQLQNAMIDKDTVNVLEDANTHMKDHAELAEKIEDMIMDDQEAKMHQDEINDKLKDLVGADEEEEEVDDLMNELMGEINREKKQQVQGKKIEVSVPQQKMKQEQKRDEIQDMLNNL